MPGCRETVPGGRNGILVPPRDPVALADALQRLIEDPELRHRMGEASRALAEERFSLAAVVERHRQVYAELASHAGMPL